MEKDCLQCNKTFKKPYTRSKRDFLERAKFCSVSCRSIYDKGKCPEKLLAFHKTRIGKPAHNRGKDVKLTCNQCKSFFTVFEWRARQNPQFCSHKCASQFKDYGKTKIQKKIRQRTSYKNWRISVFQRDNFTCQACGERGGELNADHIKPFAYFPELRLELSNGRTLCVDCHKKTDTWGGRASRILKETLWANAV